MTLPLIDWIPDVSWHDQQRIGQLPVFLLAFAITPILIYQGAMTRLVSKWAVLAIQCVIFGALISAALAEQPLWASVEVSVGISCLALAWSIAMLRRQLGASIDVALLAALFFVSGALAARFLVAYAAAVSDPDRVMDAWLLLDGFSNPRFYGQFLTMALPLLAVPMLAAGRLRSYSWISLVLTTLAWTLVIISGTRGSWLGLGCAMVLMLCVSSLSRRWVLMNSLAAVVGVGLFWLLMVFVPELLGMETLHSAASRLTTTLSRRDIIWPQALQVILQHPLLGIGPMQLAAMPNGVATHPHQAWLQWAAELGLPSALLVSVLVFWAGATLIKRLRQTAGSRQEANVLRLCLTATLTASLAQAMVDGVLVMPYSQLWFSISAGWALGLTPTKGCAIAGPPKWALAVWGVTLLVSIALLTFVTVRDLPRLDQREQAFEQTLGGRLQPRFWSQGSIAPEVESALATLRAEQLLKD